jgi:hypothetical protein
MYSHCSSPKWRCFVARSEVEMGHVEKGNVHDVAAICPCMFKLVGAYAPADASKVMPEVDSFDHICAKAAPRQK